MRQILYITTGAPSVAFERKQRIKQAMTGDKIKDKETSQLDMFLLASDDKGNYDDSKRDWEFKVVIENDGTCSIEKL